MRLTRSHALAVSALLLSAACDDVATNSAGPERVAVAPATKMLGTITCHVDVVAQTSRCGDLIAPGGPSENRFILDSAYWTLVTGAQFNSGGLAHFFNEIRNDLGQDIGVEGMTTDSVFAFITNITTTGGSGTVTPANHDGTRGFTAPSQAYWVWEGAVSPNSTTTTRIWQFNLPATVTSWTYTIGVQTTVMHPNGWIEVGGNTQIPLGNSTQLTAVVRDWTGTVDTGGSVTWTVTSFGGSVTTTVNNSRQATFTGTGVGFVRADATKGVADPHGKTLEVY